MLRFLNFSALDAYKNKQFVIQFEFHDQYYYIVHILIF